MARDVGGVSAKSPLQAGKPLLTVKPSHLGTLEWAMPGLQEKFTCFQEGTGSTVMEPESKLEIPVEAWLRWPARSDPVVDRRSNARLPPHPVEMCMQVGRAA